MDNHEHQPRRRADFPRVAEKIIVLIPPYVGLFTSHRAGALTHVRVVLVSRECPCSTEIATASWQRVFKVRLKNDS